MIFKLIFLCLTPLLRAITSKTFCVLCHFYSIGAFHLFHWVFAITLKGFCETSIGNSLLKRRLVLPKTQARSVRQSVILLFSIQSCESKFLLSQRIEFSIEKKCLSFSDMDAYIFAWDDGLFSSFL